MNMIINDMWRNVVILICDFTGILLNAYMLLRNLYFHYEVIISK